MPADYDQIRARLNANRLPGLDLGDGLMVPDSSGHSLLNLPASLCRLLGVPGLGPAAPVPELSGALADGVRHVMLVVLDGLGLERFERALHAGDAPVWRGLLPEALFLPLTSVAPSTTVAALTTLWTGASPGAHGLVGYELWLKEFGLMTNMIVHSPISFANDPGSLRRAGFDPETFLPVPTLGPHLVSHGVRVQAFMHQALARSGLSTMHLPGAHVYPFRTVSDLWISAREWALRDHSGRTYTYLYWSDVDEISHRFGPGNARVEADFTAFSGVFEREFVRPLAARARKDILVLVTADHGLIHTPARLEFDLRNHPEFIDMLHMLPSGENRLAYLFARPGKLEALREYVQRAWPGQFALFTAEEALRGGLFGLGPYSPRLPERIGDLVAVARGDAYWWWAAKDNQMNGRHGGLSPEEMLVPLFGFRI